MSTADDQRSIELKISRDHRMLGRQRRPSDVEGDHRIRRGVFASLEEWNRTDDLGRYRALIAAVAATRLRRIVFSHESAAALAGIPLLGPLPQTVHATTSPDSRRRSRAGVEWHHVRLDDEDIVSTAGFETTSVPRTLIDLAKTSSFAAAVVSLDAGIADETMPRQPRWDSTCLRVGVADLETRLDGLGRSPGSKRAAAALDFADHRSGSVGESLSRVQMHAWGLEPPDLQVPVVGRSGVGYIADFAWGDGALLGEFDGRLKYSRGRVRGDATADDVVWAEKRREDDLRAAGHDVARWTWGDALDGAALASILGSHGLSHSGRQPRPVFRKGNS